MALYMNFPANPTDGQEYASPLGISYYYSSQYNVWTTFIIPATGYVANVVHFFNNTDNTTLSITSSNPGIIVTPLNQTAADSPPSASCPFNPIYKRYSVSFSIPFANTAYSVNVYDVSNVAAGGASSVYNSFIVTDKTVSGFNLQFCARSNASPGQFIVNFRRSFSIQATAA